MHPDSFYIHDQFFEDDDSLYKQFDEIREEIVKNQREKKAYCTVSMKSEAGECLLVDFKYKKDAMKEIVKLSSIKFVEFAKDEILFDSKKLYCICITAQEDENLSGKFCMADCNSLAMFSSSQHHCHALGHVFFTDKKRRDSVLVNLMMNRPGLMVYHCDVLSASPTYKKRKRDDLSEVESAVEPEAEAEVDEVVADEVANY